jgi:hypothetical protein
VTRVLLAVLSLHGLLSILKQFTRFQPFLNRLDPVGLLPYWAFFAPKPGDTWNAADSYWLQYLIYTLVVHRLLRRRLPDYDYDRHMAGVRYLFVRGMHPERGLETGVYRDRPSKALVEAFDALVTPAERVR